MGAAMTANIASREDAAKMFVETKARFFGDSGWV